MMHFSSLKGLSARLARPLAALALLAATAGAARAQGPSFATSVNYPSVGNSPYGLAVADVNGDGRADLVTGNNSSGNISVLLGQATAGTFGAAATYASGTGNPIGISAGDVNGDGRPDVVVANNGGGVSVLLNSGSAPGTFPTRVSYAANGSRMVALRDVNGDGLLDIATAGFNDGTLGVLLNSSTTPGTFLPVAYYAGNGSSATGVAVGDVNGDGRADVVTCDRVSASIGVFLNSSSTPGTFLPVATYATGGNAPFAVALGDLDGDGRLDVIVANATSNQVGVLLNRASTPGTFQPVANYSGGGSTPVELAVADVNGDGRLDVATTNSQSSAVGVLLGSATTPGTLGAPVAFSTGAGSGPRGVALQDVNADGRPDLVTAGFSNNTVNVLLNTSGPAPVLTRLSPTSGPVGTTVTLTGTDLAGAMGVSFNGTAATTFAVVNATTVTATVPTGASSGLVTVTTPTGTSNGLNFVVGTPANNALDFDGTNDYVDLGTRPSLQFGTGDFTAEVWARNDRSSGTTYTLALGSLGVGGNNQNFWLGAKTGFAALGLSGTDFVTPVSIADGRWHHLAAARTGGTLVLYVDGVASLTQASPQDVSTASPFYLGNYAVGSGQSAFYWQGRLDEARLYNVGLTAAQVQADMYSTTSARPASQVAYFNFDQGIAGGTNTGITTLPDLSGTGNTGTLTNFALAGASSNWVRSFPTITGLSPASGTAGTSVSITGTNLTDATGFAFNGTPTTGFATPTSDLTATVTVPTGATTGPVSVASAQLTRYNGPVFTVTVTAVTWTGALSTDWATAGNWSPAVVPTSSIDAIIPSAPTNQPSVSGTQAAKNLTVQAGARLTLAGGATPGLLTLGAVGNVGSFTLASGSTLTQGAGSEIYLTGNLTNNGATFALDPLSEIGFGIVLGAPHLLNGTAGVTFQTLTVGEQGSFDNLSMQVPVQVRRKLGVYNNSNTSLGTGGSLTLLSDATGTALVENGTGSTVGGTVTVQRYIDPSLNAGPGYRHYSAPVSNSTVADLATSGFSPEVSQAATYNASATPGLVTPFPTVYAYDQSRVTLTNTYTPFDRGFVVPAAASTPLVVGQGYAVNIAANQLVDFVGTLNNGPVSRTLARNAAGTANATDAGWQLVGNPYPAPLDYSSVIPADRAGLDPAMYVFESASPYTGAYRPYVNGVPAANRYVASGQGFFVRVSAGQTSGTLNFRNVQRVTDPATQVPFRRNAADARPLVQLDLHGATGPADALYAYAEAGATPAFDAPYDAVKLPNSTGLNLSSAATSGEALAIDGRPAFTAATVLPLNVGVPAAGTYTFTAAALNNLPVGLDAYLRDAQTGQTVNLRTQPSYAFTVTTAQATALLVGRFTLQFAAAALATAPALTAAQVSVYPNPATARFTVLMPGVAGAAAVQAELLNALGQVVHRQSAALPASGATLQVETANLAAGVYTLRLLAGATTVAKRVVVQ
jgi:hypothetical protein